MLILTQWHSKSRKKRSGGFRNSVNRSTKKLAWKGGTFAATKVEEKDLKTSIRARGNNLKQKLKTAKTVSFTDLKGKTSKAAILSVLENPADRHFARRDIITKGGIIEIEVSGKKVNAIVTSRPGQSGTISAKLYEGKIESVEKKAEKEAKKAKKPEKTKKETKKAKKVKKTEKTKEKEQKD